MTPDQASKIIDLLHVLVIFTIFSAASLLSIALTLWDKNDD